ncbi:hypothetical protein KK062_14875 [Fulvivirgaceae bacterium PWU5]|uniref:Uncharacterized protein n=1 Tax=Dawidia cretensis TaxID=2782350 RepID=A0AAP2DY47_9BACT|nr:hypothetical protein [Dawidia cretensis]MBT1709523.1 hypothetical protein [Dawidia cretensis]
MRVVLFLLLSFCTFASYGQADTLLARQQHTLDSLIKKPLHPGLDSVQHDFYASSDSLKNAFRGKFVALDSSQAGAQHVIDSLQALNLPHEKYVQKLDSIRQKRESEIQSLNQKMGGLKSKATQKIDGRNLPPEAKDQIAQVTGNIDGFQLPVKDLNLGAVGVNSPFGSLDGLSSSVESPVGKIGELGGMPELPGELGQVKDVTGQLGGYQQDIKNIAGGNLEDVKQIPGALEGKAAEATGLGDVAKQAESLNPMLDAAKNPDAMKQQAIKQVQQQAVNHFAGKEQVLQQAMEKMSKLKSKYSSLNSLKDIPKRRPNEMRGKPLRERLLPGIALQIQKKGDDILVDFNPYIGYRLSGRLTSGLGWNHRVGYNTDHNLFTSATRVYGPRVYGEFRLGKGFSPRAELECMNTYVPQQLQTPVTDPGVREWVPGAFVGMKKDYRFIGSVKGTAMIMLRVFNVDHKSPYADVLNVRFGFEFPQKKRKAKKADADKNEEGYKK